MIRSVEAFHQRKRLPLAKVDLRTVPRSSHPLLLDRGDLLSLYHAVAAQLQPDRPRVLEIISSNHGEGTSTIARELARVIALELAQPVLLVVVNPPPPPIPGLEAVANGEQPFDAVIDVDANLPLFYKTTLCLDGSNKSLLFDRGELDQLLTQALRHAKLIIIDAPPALSEISGVALARRAGGVLLVVEAERTRAPIVDQARRVIESGGGRLLGIVMNKRKFHIPRPVYRRL